MFIVRAKVLCMLLDLCKVFKIVIFVAGTPATVDFLHGLNTDFKSNVTDHLDKLSRDAFLSQDDPARMRDCIAQRIRKAILNCVYGKRKYITHLSTLLATHHAKL
jgi:hypothetical protein